jgi:hypothetical protein
MESAMAERIRLGSLALATILYVASMFLPIASFTLFGSRNTFPGWFGFLAGMLAPFSVRAGAPPELLWEFASWFANPAFWASLCYLTVRKFRASLLTAALSVLLAVVAIGEVVKTELWQWPAYWTWLGSFVVLTLGALVSDTLLSESRREVESVELPTDAIQAVETSR